MPAPCYISIEANITAGSFTADSVGNIYVEGHEDEMMVQAFDRDATQSDFTQLVSYVPSIGTLLYRVPQGLTAGALLPQRKH